MTIRYVAPGTVHELAALSAGLSILFYGVDTSEQNELLKFVVEHRRKNEGLVVLKSTADCFVQVEAPPVTPAIGAWHGAGFLCGYEHRLPQLAAFIEECRGLGQ